MAELKEPIVQQQTEADMINAFWILLDCSASKGGDKRVFVVPDLFTNVEWTKPTTNQEAQSSS